MSGSASGTIAPRMPALEANADVTAATAQSSRAATSGVAMEAMPPPTASMVP